MTTDTPIRRAIERLATEAPWVSRAAGLFTIPKSGTQWVRIFLGNYLAYQYCGQRAPLSYRQIAAHYLPSVIHSGPGKGFGMPRVTSFRLHNPHSMFSKAPISNIIYGHISEALDHVTFQKIVLVRRNPLDNFASMVHFRYRARESWFDDRHVSNVIPIWCATFIPSYLRIQQMKRSLPPEHILSLSYEEMVVDPSVAFSRLLRFLEVPLGDDALAFALEASSLGRVAEDERQHGPIHQPAGVTTSFIRSGQIGRWRADLAPNVVDEIVRMLDLYRISLDEFTLDHPSTPG